MDRAADTLGNLDVSAATGKHGITRATRCRLIPNSSAAASLADHNVPVARSMSFTGLAHEYLICTNSSSAIVGLRSWIAGPSAWVEVWVGLGPMPLSY